MAANTSQVKRTREIEEVTNLYFIHPISRALVTVFEKVGLHPNVVSLGGIAFGALAAWAYYQYDRWEMALAGFVFMIGWHIMDGADGQLARLTGKTSELGKALDGLVDHLSFTMVYVSLTLAAAGVWGNWVWWLAVAAGLSHLVQASSYEFQRQSYDYWVLGKESSRPIEPEEYRASASTLTGVRRLFSRFQLLYLNLQFRMAGVNHALVNALEAAKAEARGNELQNAYRSTNLDAVKWWSILCSNYRTIAIFAACLAKNPLYFFIFEILFLNSALFALRVMQARKNQVLIALLNSDPVAEPDALAAT